MGFGQVPPGHLSGGRCVPPGLQKGVPITLISPVYGVKSKLSVKLKGEMTKFPLYFACDCKLCGFAIWAADYGRVKTYVGVGSPLERKF